MAVEAFDFGPDFGPDFGAGFGAGFEPGCDGHSVVLVGVDGTATSLRALAYAFGLARRQGGVLIAAYAGGS